MEVTRSDRFNLTVNNTVVGCPRIDKALYPTIVGINLAVPPWEALGTAIVLSLIIVLTIVGNILVILSVFTYRPLRIVQNFFIVSLAVADLTVAILVLPLNVAYSLLGRWEFGIHLCKMWLTCDVLCCTSSILNLSAIALDRYWAIHDPINYAQKRTVERVLLLIVGVWVLSLIISSPPLIGWNDWPDEFSSEYPCQLTTNQGYVVYSSLGSFFIPLVIMTIVYIEIYLATKKRLRQRASKINAANLNAPSCKEKITVQHDQESISSENNLNNEPSHMLLSDEADGKSTTSNATKVKHKERRQKENNPLKTEHEFKRQTASLGPDNSVVEHGTVVQVVTAVGTETARQHSKGGDDAAALVSKQTTAVSAFIEEKQRISLSKERKAARTLGIIMGVFVVCWLPFFLMYVIVPFCSSCCPSDKFTNFITWLGYVNSALNPIIYTIFNIEYRRAFKKLLGF